MAAVATKKPGGDVAVQLTFPAVFANVYADSGEAEQFAPTFPLAPPPMREAVDLQGAYHEQKRQDAHRMVMAGVAATKEADRKMLVSYANYYGMPKPVLGQRRFANPSLGNQPGAIDSARRTMPGSTAPFRCVSVDDATGAGNGCGSCYETQMRGGVLFTKTGQQWAANKLQARVQQLNAIDAAAMTSDALDSGTGVEYKTPADLQELPLKAQLDMSALFGDLLNSLMAGNTRAIAQYALADLGKLTRLVARWSITATDDEFREALQNIDAIYEAVLAQAAIEQDVVVEAAEMGGPEDIPQWDLRRVMEVIAPRVAALRQYIGEMYDVRSLTPRDRKAASKTFLKSTGLTKLAIEPLGGDLRALVSEVIMGRNRRPDAPEAVRGELAEMADDRARNIERRREGEAAVDPPRFRVRRGPDDNSDDDDQFDAPARPAAPLRAPGGGAPRFAVDRRQQMGARHGAFVGEAIPQLDVIEMGVRNPARQMAPAALRPIAMAADPVFEDMAAVPAGAAAEAAPARRRAPRARAPVVIPGADIRRYFAPPGAAEPRGQGRAKRGKGKEEEEAMRAKMAAKDAMKKKSHEAMILQQMKAHVERGEPVTGEAAERIAALRKEAADRLAAFKAHKAAAPERKKADDSAAAAGLTSMAFEAMTGYPSVRPEKAAELYSASKRSPRTVEGRKAAMFARVAARILDPTGSYPTPKIPRTAMTPADAAMLSAAFSSTATAAAPRLSPGAALLDRVKKATPGAASKKATPGAASKKATPSGRGKPSPHGLTRAMLPKDRDGYVALAAELRGKGHDIRVNSGSQLKSIRANFIKKLGL
jgi:hypothetical protein